MTYDGGVALLDGESLEMIQQVEMDGFLRVNPAGDDNHVMVSTDNGFSVLDATHASLTDVSFDGSEPGHVVLHGGKTVLYFDGDGRALSFDPHELAEGEPQDREYTSAEPHHGVAVELADGTMISSVGNEETRPGAVRSTRTATRSPPAASAPVSTVRPSPPTRSSGSVARTAFCCSRTASS